ncbi:MAG: hypothetical protein AAFZ65_13630, partial [Planctomycetota bacterium]
MHKHLSTLLLAGAWLAVDGIQAHAQQSVPANGQTTTVAYSGTYVDYQIPTENPPAFLRLSAKGGRGGNAVVGSSSSCRSYGGLGALVEGVFAVGTQPGQLDPGGVVRVVVGNLGETGYDTQFAGSVKRAAGGGGGGTGVLFSETGNPDTFEALIVAGGGGGAHQGSSFFFCGSGRDGVDASLTPCGTSDSGGNNAGGCDGSAGTSSSNGGIAGGGLLSGDSACGGTGGSNPGLEVGGAASLCGWDGGYGFGSGGGTKGTSAASSDQVFGGGGGGGYSGGGGGFAPIGSAAAFAIVAGGGGGGSFVSSSALTETFTHSSWPFDGEAKIESLPPANGELCESPFILLDNPNPGSSQLPTFSFVGSDPSVATSCSQASPGREGWFKFENKSTCVETVYFTSNGAGGHIERRNGCEANATECYPLDFLGAFATFSVGVGETAYFRMEGNLANPDDAVYELIPEVIAVGLDSDADGVGDCKDNCSEFNPNQNDDDGDGVGDACDTCPGFNDTQDGDGDGVPNGCDDCPGDNSADMDGDGIPDTCDPYLGDNVTDTDGDGIPDVIDFCDGGAEDCDHNGIGDECDFVKTARFEDFNDALYANYTFNEDSSAAQGLAILSGGEPFNIGTLNFAPVSPLVATGFSTKFLVRHTQTGAAAGDGFSFSAYDASLFGPDVVFGEEGLPLPGALSLVFDTYANGADPNDNHIELRVGSESLGTYIPTFRIADGDWLEVVVEVVNEQADVTVGIMGQVGEQAFQNVLLP